MNERDLFMAALQIEDAAERSAYLDRECVGKTALRQRLEALLGAFEQAGSFLQQPAGDPRATSDVSHPGQSGGSDPAEGPGTVIGPYKLIEQIGEGGMGRVWMAQQTEPVRRLVAVKLIKAGMDSRQVIARFEAERQALALMDHPNIARVLGGGTTEGGRPYFVMDLVKGVPITRYCDEHHLTPRQRLELFVPVCQAVQHAHQKGVIHRDLKPGNVLVALYDGQPVPKVIDFGVAKAAGQQLTDKTLVTGFGALVGTLEYMSPEQAEVNQLDIDTRSDIYALGVLLYELLTGTTPLEHRRVKQAGLLEALRIIREEETPRPSTRLSTAEELPAIAANRGTEPKKLSALFRGELDWIVMKSLEKDRSRRYETANEFALDVQRHLADEPVQACPPSAWYRLRKFARRNRGAVVAASAILLCLLAGVIGTTVALVWAVRERDEKGDALIAETSARAAEGEARDKALASLRAMTDEIVENQMARGTQLTEENKEFLRTIIRHFESFAAITADDAESRAIRAEGYQRVGLMRNRLGEFKGAEAAYAEALALWKQLAAEFPARPEFRRGLAATLHNLGVLRYETGRLKEAEAAYADALALKKQLAAEFPTRPEFRQELAMSHNNLGTLHQHAGRLKQAEAAYEEVVAIRKSLVADFPARPEFRHSLALTHNNLGYLLQTMGRLKGAEAAYADALALQKRLAAESPTRPKFRQELASSHNNLALLLRATGRPKEAEAAHAEALALRKQLAAEFPTRPEFRRELANSLNNLGALLHTLGRLKDSEKAVADALVLWKQLAGDFPTRPEYRQGLARCHESLGGLLRITGRLGDAETAYGDALALCKQLTADFPTRPEFRLGLASSLHSLGELLRATGKLTEAESALAETLALLKQLAAESPNQLSLRNATAETCGGLALLRLGQKDLKAAKAYLDEARLHEEAALKANPRHPGYRQNRRNNLKALIQVTAGSGDPAGAKQAARKLRDLGWDPPADAYAAACGLSLCIPIVQSDDRATREERDKQAAFYGDEAMRMLRDAAAKGYKDAAGMDKSQDLAPLRERGDFKRLLAEVQANKK
jgi:serine/threonine protein kinase/tetratricopeptide (TPR) repeat protein